MLFMTNYSWIPMSSNMQLAQVWTKLAQSGNKLHTQKAQEGKNSRQKQQIGRASLLINMLIMQYIRGLVCVSRGD